MEMAIEVAIIKVEVNEKFFHKIIKHSSPSDIEMADMVVDCLIAVWDNKRDKEKFNEKLREFLTDSDLIEDLRKIIS